MNFDGRRRFEDGLDLTPAFYGYIIEHSDILTNNKAHFIEFWNIDRIAKAGRLHDMFGKVRFAINGYDYDQRELFEIPEVRTFLRELTDEWPYFFFAADLEDSFLGILIKSIVQTITVIRAPNSPTDWMVKLKPPEVNAVCDKLRVGFLQAVKIDGKLGQSQCDARMARIVEYVRSGRLLA
jgi:hypothetical protein